jgi:DnaJ-class molecular chaperone
MLSAPCFLLDGKSWRSSMICFEDVDEARKTLGLGRTATFGEIKEAYRSLSLKYHPDKCADEDRRKCEAMFKKINEANRILMSYCDSYRYSFAEEDVKEFTGEAFSEEHNRRFYEDLL